MARSRRRNGRAIDGVLLLDKPKGLSSNEALQQVKWFYKGAKAGHTGALDPLATGLLPICFGEATKFSQFLLESDKTYTVVAQLGIKTETGDAEGAEIARAAVPELQRDQLEAILDTFKGPGEQVPSMYSALKYKGEPLYKLARQGIEVEREARPIMIFKLDLLEFKDDLVELEVECSKGTYIRTLVEDIGEHIGCGAHVQALRRTQAGPYHAEQMLTMGQLQALSEAGFSERQQVKERYPEVFAVEGKVKPKLTADIKAELDQSWSQLDQQLLTTDSAVGHLPRVDLGETAAYYIKQGQPVQVSNVPPAGLVRLCVEDDGLERFIGVGEINAEGMVAPARLIATQ